MKKLLVIFCFCAVFVTPVAAVKRQIFLGSGVVSPWNGGTKSISTAGGFAMILPVSQQLFLRPLFGGGANLPLNGVAAVPVLQGGVLVGFKVSQRISLLTGTAVVWSFPDDKPHVILPTALFSSAIRLTPHWGIFTPFAVNKKSASLSLQAGYTW